MRDTFTLEGMTYTQQYRKCGKPTCTACVDGGPGHGPYWYARSQSTGLRRYIGRELPIEVISARQALNWQLPELYRQRDGLHRQAAALDKLIRKEPLSSVERELIDWLGFGDCLVQMPAPATAQEKVFTDASSIGR